MEFLAVPMASIATVAPAGFPASSKAVRIPKWLTCAPELAEALRHSLFLERWNDSTDGGFRGYAVAILQLAITKRLSAAERITLYRRLCTKRRVELLGEVLNTPIAPRVVRLIGLADWRRFSRRDWQRLLDLARAEGVDSPLGHVPRITATLVRQFASIPQALRLPAILHVACTLALSARRWECLANCLRVANAGRRAELLRIAGTVNCSGTFWDFYVRCEGNYYRPFDLPLAALESPLLQAITTPQEMDAEALRMRNCLAIRIGQVQTGNRIYFRLADQKLVNAELVRSGDRWVPGDVLGPENAAVPEEMFREVRAELGRLASCIAFADPCQRRLQQDTFVKDLSESARQAFVEDDVAKLREPLRQIRAKTISWGQDAWAYFERPNRGYVQFMSSPDGSEYLCEISSHKYLPAVNRYLSEDAVEVIDRAGFAWPRKRANFLRWFKVSSEDDLQAMAEFGLAILARVFTHGSGQALEVKWHIPQSRRALQIDRICNIVL